MADIYQRLASFLDELPAGYPSSENGVELSILRKLFTPEEAEIFTHLSLIGEAPRVVAYRAHEPVETTARILDEMERKGLVSGSHKPGKPVEYAVNQFVVGFYEEQVDRLDRELVDLLEAYLPMYFKHGPWTKVPQIRTIPIGVSIPFQTDVMPYLRAEEIIHRHTVFAVRNCVCRQERQILGKGCSKPMETCMSFDGGAEYTVQNGRGRLSSKDEVLAILKQAETAGLVLQPANSKDPSFICACCGCCCGVLRGLKMQDKPASLVANPFIARHDADLCSSCEACIDRCQMEAITSQDGTIVFTQDRCIGCGLCVSTCPSGAMTLVRKPESEQPAIPRDTTSTYLTLGKARGQLNNSLLINMVAKSKIDRLMAPD